MARNEKAEAKKQALRDAYAALAEVAERVGLVLPPPVKGEGAAAGARRWTWADGWERITVEIDARARIRWHVGAHVLSGEGVRTGEGTDSLAEALGRFVDERDRRREKPPPRLRLVR